MKKTASEKKAAKAAKKKDQGKTAEAFIEETEREVAAPKKKKLTIAERLALLPQPQIKLVDDAQRLAYVEAHEA